MRITRACGYRELMVSLSLLAAACAPRSPACADTIRYRDGKTITAVVLKETSEAVTVDLYGQKLEIPRSRIESIEKAAGEENEKLRRDWRKLNRDYREESREAEEKAIRLWRLRAHRARPEGAPQPAARPTLPGPPLRPLPPFPPSRAAAEARKAPLRRPAAHATGKDRGKQAEILWKEEVRKAIHEKRVVTGMTKNEVRSAWGWPDRTHPVHGIDVDTDRWTYRRKGEGLVDLYFRNGVLTRIGR